MEIIPRNLICPNTCSYLRHVTSRNECDKYKRKLFSPATNIKEQQYNLYISKKCNECIENNT